MDVFTGLLLIFLGYGGGYLFFGKKIFQKRSLENQRYNLERAEKQTETYFEEIEKKYENALKHTVEIKDKLPFRGEEWKEILIAQSDELTTLERLRKVFIKAKERMRYESYEKQMQLFDDWLNFIHIDSKILLEREAYNCASYNEVADDYLKSLEKYYLVRDKLEKRILDYLK
ncbi:MAG: hypothetical protein ABH837_01205 [bacterium]